MYWSGVDYCDVFSAAEDPCEKGRQVLNTPVFIDLHINSAALEAMLRCSCRILWNVATTCGKQAQY